MKNKASVNVVPIEKIERRIFLIRNHKVMLSMDLAELYGVEPRALVQAVKRNRERFPDLMRGIMRQSIYPVKQCFRTI